MLEGLIRVSTLQRRYWTPQVCSDISKHLVCGRHLVKLFTQISLSIITTPEEPRGVLSPSLGHTHTRLGVSGCGAPESTSLVDLSNTAGKERMLMHNIALGPMSRDHSFQKGWKILTGGQVGRARGSGNLCVSPR